MNEPRRVSVWILVPIVFLICVLFFDMAYADDTIQSNDMNTVKGDIAITDRSYGLSGSDMDIGQCMYHAGALTVAIGFRNKFCEGMDMIRVGLVEAGVLHICKQTKIGKNYKTLEDCKTGLAIVYVGPSKNDTQGDLGLSEPTQDDEDDERIEALYSRMAAYEDSDAQRIAEAQIAAKRPIAPPQTIIQQQAFINASKRAKLSALRGEK